MQAPYIIFLLLFVFFRVSFLLTLPFRQWSTILLFLSFSTEESLSTVPPQYARPH